MAPNTITPQPDDVLCGKDKKSFNHPGNKRFREVVAFYLERYKNAKKRSEKAEIADSIGAACVGRFLRPDESGVFHELDKRGVREKITHALRDAVRKQLDGRTQREKRNIAAQARAREQDAKMKRNLPTTPTAIAPATDPISLAIRKARKQELDTAQRESNDQAKAEAAAHQAHQKALEAETQAMARRNSIAQKAMEAEQAALARRHSIAQQTMAARASFTAPFGGPYAPPPMGMVDGGKPIDLTAEEQQQEAARKVSLPNSPAFSQAKADAMLGRSYYEEAALLRNPPMPPMGPLPPPHMAADMARIPALMEQVRTLQMMAAMRDKEIGSLRLALCDATAAGTAKDEEISKLKEELAMKDRALKGNSKRGKTADPPTN